MKITYPHSIIAKKCRQKYQSAMDLMECVINSLILFYNPETRQKLSFEKYVEPEEIEEELKKLVEQGIKIKEPGPLKNKFHNK